MASISDRTQNRNSRRNLQSGDNPWVKASKGMLHSTEINMATWTALSVIKIRALICRQSLQHSWTLWALSFSLYSYTNIPKDHWVLSDQVSELTSLNNTDSHLQWLSDCPCNWGTFIWEWASSESKLFFTTGKTPPPHHHHHCHHNHTVKIIHSNAFRQKPFSSVYLLSFWK